MLSGNTFSNMFDSLIKLIIVLFIGSMLLGVILYNGYNYFFNEKVIESKYKVKPDYRLEANGKVVDTIYIYKFK